VYRGREHVIFVARARNAQLADEHHGCRHHGRTAKPVRCRMQSDRQCGRRCCGRHGRGSGCMGFGIRRARPRRRFRQKGHPVSSPDAVQSEVDAGARSVSCSRRPSCGGDRATTYEPACRSRSPPRCHPQRPRQGVPGAPSRHDGGADPSDHCRCARRRRADGPGVLVPRRKTKGFAAQGAARDADVPVNDARASHHSCSVRPCGRRDARQEQFLEVRSADAAKARFRGAVN